MFEFLNSDVFLSVDCYFISIIEHNKTTRVSLVFPRILTLSLSLSVSFSTLKQLKLLPSSPGTWLLVLSINPWPFPLIFRSKKKQWWTFLVSSRTGFKNISVWTYTKWRKGETSRTVFWSGTSGLRTTTQKGRNHFKSTGRNIKKKKT